MKSSPPPFCAHATGAGFLLGLALWCTAAHAGTSKPFPIVWNPAMAGCSEYDIAAEQGDGPCTDDFRGTVESAAERMCAQYGMSMTRFEIDTLNTAGGAYVGRGTASCRSAAEERAARERAEADRKAAEARRLAAEKEQARIASETEKRRIAAEKTAQKALLARREAAAAEWEALEPRAARPALGDSAAFKSYVTRWEGATEQVDGFAFPLNVPEVADARAALKEAAELEAAEAARIESKRRRIRGTGQLLAGVGGLGVSVATLGAAVFREDVVSGALTREEALDVAVRQNVIAGLSLGALAAGVTLLVIPIEGGTTQAHRATDAAGGVLAFGTSSSGAASVSFTGVW